MKKDKQREARTKRITYWYCIHRPSDGGPEKRIYLDDYVERGEEGHRTLRAMSDRRELLCADCGEVMVLHWSSRDPPRETPHFQHLRPVGPDHPVPRPQSKLHRRAQRFIRRLLETQLPGVLIEEEHTLPSGRRADLYAGLAAASGGKLLDLDLEIQRSPDPTLEERTRDLESDGVRVVWIFGVPSLEYLTSRKGISKMEMFPCALCEPLPGSSKPGSRLYIILSDKEPIALVRSDDEGKHKVLSEPILDPARGVFLDAAEVAAYQRQARDQPDGFSDPAEWARLLTAPALAELEAATERLASCYDLWPAAEMPDRQELQSARRRAWKTFQQCRQLKKKIKDHLETKVVESPLCQEDIEPAYLSDWCRAHHRCALARHWLRFPSLEPWPTPCAPRSPAGEPLCTHAEIDFPTVYQEASRLLGKARQRSLDLIYRAKQRAVRAGWQEFVDELRYQWPGCAAALGACQVTNITNDTLTLSTPFPGVRQVLNQDGCFHQIALRLITNGIPGVKKLRIDHRSTERPLPQYPEDLEAFLTGVLGIGDLEKAYGRLAEAYPKLPFPVAGPPILIRLAILVCLLTGEGKPFGMALVKNLFHAWSLPIDDKTMGTASVFLDRARYTDLAVKRGRGLWEGRARLEVLKDIMRGTLHLS